MRQGGTAEHGRGYVQLAGRKRTAESFQSRTRIMGAFAESVVQHQPVEVRDQSLEIVAFRASCFPRICGKRRECEARSIALHFPQVQLAISEPELFGEPLADTTDYRHLEQDLAMFTVNCRHLLWNPPNRDQTRNPPVSS